MMDYMVIEATHEKTSKPIIVRDIVCGDQHMHHPAMFKLVILIGQRET
jgi:hypothetical protein